MRRSLPALVLLCAVLLTAWWGGRALLESAGPGSGSADDGTELVVAAPSAAAGPPPAPPEEAPGPPAVRRVAGTLPGGEEPRAPVAPDPGPEPGPAVAAPPAEAPPTPDPEPEPGASLVPGVVVDPDPVTVSNTAPVPADAEVRVPPGLAVIGTPPEQVWGMIRTRGDTAPGALPYEAPAHTVEMEGYWIERTEVTEQRYREFLEEAARVEFTTPLGRARTLFDTTVLLLGSRSPMRTGADYERATRQLYEANLAALHAAAPRLVVAVPGTRVLDAEATWERFRDAALPSRVRLRFYDLPPPATWPSDEFPAGRARYPVRGISLADATEFALWAGRHVPSEVEWEYAARGPRGLDVLWGDRSTFEDLVVGGRPRERDVVPDTVPVSSNEGGASWVGALNLLGNVAEWTSSWLLPYPESELEPLVEAVDRGGSAADEDPLVVRPAFRGGTLAGPRALLPGWNVAREWVGLRLARYDEPARSRLPSMHTRVFGAGTVALEALEPRRYAGVQGLLTRAPAADWPDPGARRGAKAFVVQPVAGVAPWQGRYFLPGVPEPVADEAALLALSNSIPILLALFHADVGLPGTWALDEERRPPALRPAPCPPGTWYVVLDRGYVALLAPDLKTRFTASRAPTRPATETLRILDRPPRGSRPPGGSATLRFDPRDGTLDLEAITPLANESRPDLTLRVRLRLAADAEITRRVEDWEEGGRED